MMARVCGVCYLPDTAADVCVFSYLFFLLVVSSRDPLCGSLSMINVVVQCVFSYLKFSPKKSCVDLRDALPIDTVPHKVLD